MANGQFMVVPADGIAPGQAVGRVELYDENGDPWQPGGDGPATVAWADVTGKPASFPSAWGDITGKPSTFPSAWEDVTGKPATFPSDPDAWGDITGKPSTFPPATHTHTIAQVDGLQTILDDYEARITALEP